MMEMRMPVSPRLLHSRKQAPFILPPYLQLGDRPRLTDRGLDLMWCTQDDGRDWQVAVRIGGRQYWRKPVVPLFSSTYIGGKGSALFFTSLKNLPSGSLFDYHIIADGQEVFSAQGKSRCDVDQPFTVALPGDLGMRSNGGSTKIAYRIHTTNPDLVIGVGDLAYDRGRILEYRRDLIPVYNAGVSDPRIGAPLMRQRPMLVIPGNHDKGMLHAQLYSSFSKYADLLAYHLIWSLPSGPSGAILGENSPGLFGSPTKIARFRAAAGDRYPGFAMYSFNWGNAHFLMLDSNAYVDWTDERLRTCVRADLADACDATWRFAVLHHGPFTSDLNHFNEQRTRVLVGLFQTYGVDMVFAGHDHCFQRSRPTHFVADPVRPPLLTEDCPVSGTFQLDTSFDGKTATSPNGVIYVCGGASGAKMHPESQPSALQPFTAVYDQSRYSFPLVSIDGRRLLFRQVDENGLDVDRLVIEK
jgi:hypothetical protein